MPGGKTVWETGMVICEVMLCCGEPESVTVRTTVKLPDVVYVWAVLAPLPVEPSPKFHEKL